MATRDTATSDEMASTTGKCFARTLRPIALPSAARNAALRAELWNMSMKLTGAQLNEAAPQ